MAFLNFWLAEVAVSCKASCPQLLRESRENADPATQLVVANLMLPRAVLIGAESGSSSTNEVVANSMDVSAHSSGQDLPELQQAAFAMRPSEIVDDIRNAVSITSLMHLLFCLHYAAQAALSLQVQEYCAQGVDAMEQSVICLVACLCCCPCC